jgi:hypothetical protein
MSLSSSHGFCSGSSLWAESLPPPVILGMLKIFSTRCFKHLMTYYQLQLLSQL